MWGIVAIVVAVVVLALLIWVVTSAMRRSTQTELGDFARRETLSGCADLSKKVSDEEFGDFARRKAESVEDWARRLACVRPTDETLADLKEQYLRGDSMSSPTLQLIWASWQCFFELCLEHDHRIWIKWLPEITLNNARTHDGIIQQRQSGIPYPLGPDLFAKLVNAHVRMMAVALQHLRNWVATGQLPHTEAQLRHAELCDVQVGAGAVAATAALIPGAEKSDVQPSPKELPLNLVNESTLQQSALSSAWKCPKCGEVLHKPERNLYAIERGSTHLGSVTCAYCNQLYWSEEVYGGKYDVRLLQNVIHVIVIAENALSAGQITQISKTICWRVHFTNGAAKCHVFVSKDVPWNDRARVKQFALAFAAEQGYRKQPVAHVVMAEDELPTGTGRVLQIAVLGA